MFKRFVGGDMHLFKVLSCRVAFGVLVVYCDRGCEVELGRFFESVPERAPDFPCLYPARSF